jgi:hypothetical protein
MTEVAVTESPPIKEESSNNFWQTEARAKFLGGSPKFYNPLLAKLSLI